MQAATATPAAKVSGGASIEGRRVTKRFPGKDKPFTAIEDVSFSIKGGEFVSLIGPSGCGKSTLMLIAAGLQPASEGGIRCTT